MEKDAGRLETIADIGSAADFIRVAKDAGECVVSLPPPPSWPPLVLLLLFFVATPRSQYV